MPKTTAELEAQQPAALERNAARKRLVTDLKASNARLETRIAELEAAGADVTAIRAELDKSNRLLEQLQDAVLSDDDPPAPPPA